VRVVKAFPPNITEIRKHFPISGREMFCWGDLIYNPSGEAIPEWLIVHERVRRFQQHYHEGGIEGWWKEYLDSKDFRFEVELEAHVAEFNSYSQSDHNRHQRRAYLALISKRLSSNLYGGMVSKKTAQKLIRANQLSKN